MNPIAVLVAVVVLLAAILVSGAALAIRRNTVAVAPAPTPAIHRRRPAPQLHYQRPKAVRLAEEAMIAGALAAGVDPRVVALILRGSLRNNRRKVTRVQSKMAPKATETILSASPSKTGNPALTDDHPTQRRDSNVLAALCNESESTDPKWRVFEGLDHWVNHSYSETQ